MLSSVSDVLSLPHQTPYCTVVLESLLDMIIMMPRFQGYTFGWGEHIHTHTYIYTHTHTNKMDCYERKKKNECKCVHIDTYVCVCVCVNIYAYTCLNVHLYVCCINTHTHTHKHNILFMCTLDSIVITLGNNFHSVTKLVCWFALPKRGLFMI